MIAAINQKLDTLPLCPRRFTKRPLLPSPNGSGILDINPKDRPVRPRTASARRATAKPSSVRPPANADALR
ncbi:MAG: hypothetical protein JO283_08555 [Bradyrhizobium sp.]|nr:hypothetical protein [Bradyrhizobium sp.]